MTWPGAWRYGAERRVMAFQQIMRTIGLGKGTDGLLYSVSIDLREREQGAPFRTIRWEACSTYVELSMTGEARNPRLIDCESCGQIQDYVREVFPHDSDIQRLVVLWNRWHLNGMRAGTHEQNEALRGLSLSYDQACEKLRSLGLYAVKVPPGEDAPSGEYKYGHAWLVEPIPADVVSEVRALSNKLKARGSSA